MARRSERIGCHAVAEKLESRRVVTSSETVFELDKFQRMPVTASLALLRVNGRFRAPDPQALGTPVLVVDDAFGSHRLTTLPRVASAATAGPAGEMWHGAYSVPAALAAGACGFWLELEDGAPLDLPEPVEYRLPPMPTEGAAAARERSQLRDRQAPSEGRLGELEQERHAMQRQLAAAQAALQAASAECARMRGELEQERQQAREDSAEHLKAQSELSEALRAQLAVVPSSARVSPEIHDPEVVGLRENEHRAQELVDALTSKLEQASDRAGWARPHRDWLRQELARAEAERDEGGAKIREHVASLKAAAGDTEA